MDARWPSVAQVISIKDNNEIENSTYTIVDLGQYFIVKVRASICVPDFESNAEIGQHTPRVRNIGDQSFTTLIPNGAIGIWSTAIGVKVASEY